MPTHPLPPTATQSLKALAVGKTSAQDILEACLERIQAREPMVKAFATLDIDNARARAQDIDATPHADRGPLAGIPIGLKDIIDTAGLLTQYNSPIYATHIPHTDASVVALSRAADAVVLGKTVTAEFANRHPGPTTNPHDPARTPGGSSSGSGAAVATGMVPLALGTQTSGSVIRPASYCGVHGFKGTWGDISYAGTKLTSRSLDTIGIYARCIPDIALFRAILTMTPVTTLVAGDVAAPRIAVCLGPWQDQADPASLTVIETVAAALAKAGAKVTSWQPPPHFAGLNEAVRWIAAYEGARSMAWEAINHSDLLSPTLREGRIRDGQACSPEWYATCCRLGERCRIELESVFDDYDAILTLAAPGEAPLGLAYTGSATFNTMWTLLHVPCITIPGHTGPNGMPIGFQLVGRRSTDRRLLETATWCERAAT